MPSAMLNPASSATSPAPLHETPCQRLLLELSEELTTLTRQGLRRELTPLEAIDGPLVQIDGRWVLSWCSNDYLGLSTHPRLADAARRAAIEWGVGARASRLLAGSSVWHVQLEASLAAWFGTEAALVYPSGYHANLGTLGALLSSRDLVFIDRSAHASLFDAARASRATLRVFHHHDLSHLATLLSRASSVRRRMIVTEGLFSMEGDYAPLPALVELAEQYEAIVYVDDAHGAFVVGSHGRGTPELVGVAPRRFLYMGTLGKGLGCQGGFIVGPRVLIDLLRNRARTFIYTTALAVPVTAAAVAALELLREEPQWHARLQERVQQCHARLAGLMNRPAASSSHIVSIIVGKTQEALALSSRLWDRGIWAPAIRPPTVPEGAARLRFSVTALHSEAHIDRLVEVLRETL